MKHNYIAGAWVAAAQARDNVNPSDQSDLIGSYAQADEAQAAAAVEAAAAAFAAWSVSGI